MATTSERLARMLKNAGGGAFRVAALIRHQRSNHICIQTILAHRPEYDSPPPTAAVISGAGVFPSREAGGAIRVPGFSKTVA